MNISLEKASNVSAVLTVKMEKADYVDNVNKALKELSHKVKMPGFRPGKVPVGLMRKMYGPQTKAEEVNKLLGEKLYEYIRENKVNMLGERFRATSRPRRILKRRTTLSLCSTSR